MGNLRPKSRFCFIIFVLIIFLSGCIERYYPEEDDIISGSLVVQAHLTDQAGPQFIYLSYSSTLLLHQQNPLEGCYIQLERDDGSELEFLPDRPGAYKVDPPPGFLESGREYRLRIVSPEAQEYESEFEKLYEPMSIDSIYYELEAKEGISEDIILPGIRFITDFNVDKTRGRYLRWELVETYEFHNPSRAGFIYDQDRRYYALPDTSYWRYCWITNLLPDIYTMSLGLLNDGLFSGKELNFVSNEAQFLHHKYSLLVRQYTLSESAYNYWSDLKENSNALGGLFDRQPAILRSNICNINDEEEVVIGFFSISALSERRIFVENVEGLSVDEIEMYCFPSLGPGIPLRYYARNELPRYFSIAYLDGEPVYGETKKHCLDCRAYKNSTHIRPEYWE